MRSCVKFKKGDTVIYPQHGACIVQGTKKMEAFGATQEYLILRTVINEMTLSVPTLKTDEVGVRPPVNADELEDLVSVLSKPDPRVPSNWSRRFKNHQEKLKSGDVYQVAEVVRNLAARNRDASLSAAERTMYDRARINLISEIAPALKTINPRYAERVPLDNASLLARRVYASDLDVFDRVYEKEGRDLKRSIGRIITLAKSNPKDPFAALRGWVGS